LVPLEWVVAGAIAYAAGSGYVVVSSVADPELRHDRKTESIAMIAGPMAGVVHMTKGMVSVLGRDWLGMSRRQLLVGAVEGTPSLAWISTAQGTDIYVRKMLTVRRLLLIHLGLGRWTVYLVVSL